MVGVRMEGVVIALHIAGAKMVVVVAVSLVTLVMVAAVMVMAVMVMTDGSWR